MSEAKMGYCEKCGAIQFASYGHCNYNGVCNGKVILPDDKPEDPLVTFAKGYCKFEASFESSFNGVISGATWQKRQDNELITELLHIAEEYDKHMNGMYLQRMLNPNGIEFHKKIKETISKVENHLKSSH